MSKEKTQLDEYAKPPKTALVAEDEILKYLLAFEPLLEAKHIKYEWSFTDYHQVCAPAEGFRSIIEYVLTKATSSYYTPEFILVFSHSFENEMVIEFEIGHQLEEIDEFYFQQSDIEVLNQIYSHYGWQLSCETNHIDSLLSWNIKKFEALDKPLNHGIHKLKPKHLGDVANPQDASLTKSYAKAALVDMSQNPSKQISIILEKHYSLDQLPITQLLSNYDDAFQIIVLRGSVSEVKQALEGIVALEQHSAPVFVVLSSLDVDEKISLLAAGATDVISEPISALSLVRTIQTNVKSQFALLRNAKTGAINHTNKKLNAPSKLERDEALIIENIRQLVVQHYDDHHFDEHALASKLDMPLERLDFILKKRILHSVADYIKSCRLAEAHELIEAGQQYESVAQHCGFLDIEALNNAYHDKYGFLLVS